MLWGPHTFERIRAPLAASLAHRRSTTISDNVGRRLGGRQGIPHRSCQKEHEHLGLIPNQRDERHPRRAFHAKPDNSMLLDGANTTPPRHAPARPIGVAEGGGRRIVRAVPRNPRRVRDSAAGRGILRRSTISYLFLVSLTCVSQRAEEATTPLRGCVGVAGTGWPAHAARHRGAARPWRAADLRACRGGGHGCSRGALRGCGRATERAGRGPHESPAGGRIQPLLNFIRAPPPLQAQRLEARGERAGIDAEQLRGPSAARHAELGLPERCQHIGALSPPPLHLGRDLRGVRRP